MQQTAQRASATKRLDRLQTQANAQWLGAHGVIQAHLWEDFLTGDVNHAVAGEYHNELDEAAEIENWNHLKVNVYYEADEIPTVDDTGKKTTVSPDTLSLRLGFLVETGREKFTAFWKAFGTGADVEFDNNTSMRNQNYWASAFASDLDRMDDEPKVKAMFKPAQIVKLRKAVGEYKKYLRATDKLLLAVVKKDRKALADYMVYQIAQIGEAYNESKSAMASAKEWREYRSTAMILGINKVAAKSGNLVYKVGDSHIPEIKDAINKGFAKDDGKTAVIDRSQYMTEFIELFSAVEDVKAKQAKKKNEVKL